MLKAPKNRPQSDYIKYAQRLLIESQRASRENNYNSALALIEEAMQYAKTLSFGLGLRKRIYLHYRHVKMRTECQQ